MSRTTFLRHMACHPQDLAAFQTESKVRPSDGLRRKRFRTLVTTNPGWPRFPFSSDLKRLPHLFLSSGFPEIKRLGINLRILGAMLDTRFGHPFVE